MSRQKVKATAADVECETPDMPTRITKSLLGYGVIAGPIYIVVSLAQGLSRAGFSLAHDEWSLLANGGLGWIQIVNFVVTGLMTVAFAVGLQRAMRVSEKATWVPRLVLVYGLGLVCAGAFRADPSYGFPPGVPKGAAAHVSWHGNLHLLVAGIGFICLIAACVLVARRFARDGRGGWAAFSWATAIGFFAGFAATASAPGNVAANVVFTLAVVLGWAWILLLAIHYYQQAGRPVAVAESAYDTQQA
jgi:Protein of unknown function (DUF998)